MYYIFSASLSGTIYWIQDIKNFILLMDAGYFCIPASQVACGKESNLPATMQKTPRDEVQSLGVEHTPEKKCITTPAYFV